MATTTGTPGGVTLTDNQFQVLIGTMSNQGSTLANTSTIQPSVGGVNPVGAWTVFGAQELGQQPKASLCMRYFKGNKLKAFQALNVGN
jgi:hypothetical protein